MKRTKVLCVTGCGREAKSMSTPKVNKPDLCGKCGKEFGKWCFRRLPFGRDDGDALENWMAEKRIGAA